MVIALIKSFTKKQWRNAETYRLIEQSLREKWTVATLTPETPQELEQSLAYIQAATHDRVFVFNIAEFINEQQRVNFLPALLDDWGYPHLGSPSDVIKKGLNKVTTKHLLQKNNIRTAPFFTAGPGDDLKASLLRLSFPLFVKPIGQGGHLGISDDSIVHNVQELKRAILENYEQFKKPALVEEYIIGKKVREFSVGILRGKTSHYLPIEIDFDAMEVDNPILSYESAMKDAERIKQVEGENLKQKINQISKQAFDSLGGEDYCRVDLRMANQKIYVLEVNLMPGLGPLSFLPLAAKRLLDISYSKLIQFLTESAMQRLALS